MKRYIFLLLIATVFACVAAYFYLGETKKPAVTYPTYFLYSEEDIAALKVLSSTQKMSPDDVYYWDQVAFDLVAKNTLKETFTEETSKIYAYLAIAQRDFYFLSYQLSGKNSGSFDHLSSDVLCIFFNDDCASIVTRGKKDAYSDALAKLVLQKIHSRIAIDTAQQSVYSRQTDEQFWNGPSPETGIADGSNLGWFIESGDQFRTAPPPAFDSDTFKEQLRITQAALKSASPQEREAVVFWAGGIGTKTPSGLFLKLGDAYMDEHDIPLEKVLFVRSILALAVADATTAVFDSKFTYLVKRPFMMDTSLVTIMPTPNHPSYPAGHSTLSAAAATVLKHYFPKDAAYFEAQATEAGLSRIWGGIHYMMDHDSGVLLGTQVGETAVQKDTVIRSLP